MQLKCTASNLKPVNEVLYGTKSLVAGCNTLAYCKGNNYQNLKSSNNNVNDFFGLLARVELAKLQAAYKP